MARKAPDYVERRPHVRTRDIVVSLALETEGHRISASSVARDFDLSIGDAGRRIQYMLLWGCIRRAPARSRRRDRIRARRRGRPEVWYTITEWGRRCAATWGD